MKHYHVKHGSKIDLDDWDPEDTGDYGDDKPTAKQETKKLTARLRALQEKLYAGAERSLLIVLQGMDTSGKDGTIEKVMGGLNPQGCRVVPFKAPTEDELTHDFLWRVHRRVPGKRYIGIFNRSHYEDVVTARVIGLVSDKVAEQRMRQIVEFEKLLDENGTAVIKFFLHISKDEQKRRFQKRIDDREKRWKWNPRDLDSRALWKKYMKAYAQALSATSTERAPWYIVPANHKWYRNRVVAGTVVATLEAMNLKYPPGPKDVDWKSLRIE
jgi:PPK2 family polyphosphate:nucleotide phosphotransferase